jgi:hypothetical protein
MIPTSIEELMIYIPYIKGACRNRLIYKQEQKDLVQSFLLHCIEKDFLGHVNQRVRDGSITSSRQFKKYLSKSLKNFIINELDYEKRRCSTEFMGDESSRCNESRFSDIPENLLKQDIFNFVRDGNPSVITVLDLKRQGYTMSEIVKIIQKSSGTVTYRTAIIRRLVKEYFTK